MNTPNDFAFGSNLIPVSLGDTIATFGMPQAGASNPVAAYVPPTGVSASASAVPAPSAAAGGLGSGGLGFNMDTAKLALGGLQTLGSLWQAWQMNKLAKEQFRFDKDFANTNLVNQIKSYNTTLEDRIRARGFTEGQTDGEIQSYIDRNRLQERQIT